MSGTKPKRYKVRLQSGRVLGPLDLGQIRKFIVKSKIIGNESARDYPNGEWADINSFSELAELLIKNASGELQDQASEEAPEGGQVYSPLLHGHTKTMMAPTLMLNPEVDPSEVPSDLPQTVAIPVGKALEPGNEKSKTTENRPKKNKYLNETVFVPTEEEKLEFETRHGVDKPRASVPPVEGNPYPEELGKSERRGIRENSREQTAEATEVHESTEVGSPEFSIRQENPERNPVVKARDQGEVFSVPEGFEPPSRHLADERTVVFDQLGPRGKKKSNSRYDEKPRSPLSKVLFLVMAGYLAFEATETFFTDPPKPKQDATRPDPIKPSLPRVIEGAKPDPALSKRYFDMGVKQYQLDHVVGYEQAAKYFQSAVSADQGNVKALGLLASSYLNLIDSSNKDENYFAVISKLIEMSRAKSVDLTETVIADVEFYLTVNQAEAAKQRITEYTKANKNFEPVMYYYVARAFDAKGDPQNASRYLTLYPNQSQKIPRVEYFRGRLAEEFGDERTAVLQYASAIKANPSHVKSRLRVIEIFYRNSNLKQAAEQFDYLTAHPNLLTPPDLSRMYFLLSRFYQLRQKWDQALMAVERALRLDKENTDYLLELYTLHARLGDKMTGVKKEAQMYTLMSEGQKLMAAGLYHEAMSKFLDARQIALKSPVPLAKLGDLFMRTGEISDARMNYQKATELSPKSVEYWTKYTHALIESYDWEEAGKALEQLRKLPVRQSQSSVEKLYGDLAFRQHQYTDALLHYRKAMGFESIDSSVYIAYADTLVDGGRPADAPFFYALALRFDPLNVRARIGTARAIARAHSIDRGIEALQDYLQANSGNRADYLTAIAELNLQRGDFKQARAFVDQARAANPDYADPWKVLAQAELAEFPEDSKAVDRALYFYKSYSDRATSDPSGYLERYRLLVKQKRFALAAEELEKIFVAFPKYPNLHYFRGRLYALMGNHEVAIREFQSELKNNSRSSDTMVDLGRSLIEVGNAKDALEQFQRASILSPESAEPKALTAYANFLLKNYQAAVALYKAAIALDRGNPSYYKRLGVVYQAMGDPTSAREMFKLYLQMEPDALDRAEIQKYL